MELLWYLLVQDASNTDHESLSPISLIIFMKISIVIPTYNEAENIKTLLEQIFGLQIEGLSVIIVDDNSPDNTAQIVEGLMNKFGIQIIKRPKKLGLGTAYISGFKKALKNEADLIFEMDADFSHNPKDIPRLIKACKEYGADMSIGSRKIPGGKVIGWGIKRKIMSNGASFLSRLLLKLKTKDVTAGFRCYKKEVLKKIDLEKIKSNGYAFQEEMLYKTEKMGFKIIEVPVIFKDRTKGASKLSKKDIWEFFKIIFKLKKQR